MPTVRCPRFQSSSIRPNLVRANSYNSYSQSDVLHPHTAVALQWFGLALKFEIVQDQLEVQGYQMYAVEKWYDLIRTSFLKFTLYKDRRAQ